MKVSFNYWTNLLHCGGGGNAGGKCSVELEKKDALLFIGCLEEAKKEQNMIAYFRQHLPTNIANYISKSINDSFERVMARDVLADLGIKMLCNITEEEFQAMTEEELIDRIIKENPAGKVDYIIVNIEILNND